MIHIRKAGTLDAAPIAALITAIIEKGGTTAFRTPFGAQDILSRMERAPTLSAWHIAEDDKGTLLGVQWILPNPDLPPEAAEIATFVKIGQTGLGVGSALFNATREAAKALGYAWINATILAQNTGGLAYYQSRGFEDYAYERATPGVENPQKDRRKKRFDL